MLLGLASYASAQTNIQEMYDFNRGHFTTTIEGFHADNWGSTFFFTDIYHPTQSPWTTPTGYYTEIARGLNFWQNTKLAPLSLHVEWNGGQQANNSWLFGIEYFLHNSDFSNTFTFELMYKNIQKAKGNIPLQFTFVWGMNNLFSVKGLTFSGVFDIWGEKVNWWTNGSSDETEWVILSEPQLWYNIGQHFGCPNLNIGGEVELAYNFAGGWQSGANWAKNKGLNVAPCAGIKWVF
ncbi:MAG: DUF5020 family protein [Bacteroidales bacterium]|nr:DUF5020 family protein [Bacteroidales bacterium]